MNIAAQIADLLSIEVLLIDGMRITLGTAVFLLVFILLAISFIKTVFWTYHKYQWYKFCAQYRVDLSKSIQVRWHKKNDKNYYWLKYPNWAYANKDGSRDQRRNGNRLLSKTSILYVDRYSVFCDNPFLMVWLVNVLRRRDVEITKCQEELDKFRVVKTEWERSHDIQRVNEITDRFQEVPTDFEEFCARLFRKQGYIASVTPRSRDGGYDIDLKDGSGKTSIVECKCYGAANKVGRDTVQKLVGANATCKADQMIFITTSDYSPDAKDYARRVGVRLINGSELLLMVRQAFALKGDRVRIDSSEWRLTWDDVARGCPPDGPYSRVDI